MSLNQLMTRRLLWCLATVLLCAGWSSAAPGEDRALPPELLLAAKAAEKPKQYEVVSKKDHEEAIAAYKASAKEISEQLKVEFDLIETKHFLVFTNWDKREYTFLKTNVEAAYSAVSRQFEIPVSDNVFIGKLPIFMFSTYEDFKRFSKDIQKFDVTENTLGYFAQTKEGIGRMVMWKPNVKKHKGNVAAAEREWGTTLTHEFTHAFVARYRSAGLIPRWLNEGIAEAVALRQFPDVYTYPFVRERAKVRKSLKDIFEDKARLKGDDYPVVQTLVETMLSQGPRTFLKYVNDLKDGVEPEEALKKNFKTDYDGLEKGWRKYISTAK
jgi:hypothetical protein